MQRYIGRFGAGGFAGMCIGLIWCSLVILLLSAAPAAAQFDGTPGTPETGDDGDETVTAFNPRGRLEVVTSGGAPELVVMTSAAQAQAVVDALAPFGTQLVRSRTYPALGLQGLFFRATTDVSIFNAQVALNAVAPGSVIALHHYYRLAQGARVYAAEMVGISNPVSCRVGGNVRIGVIDGPVNPGHPALRAARIVQESVLEGDENSVSTSHGTAVAALIVGQDGSGALSGFASGAELVAVSTFLQIGRNEVADLERIAAAIDRLVARRANLVNMSFAGPRNPAFDEVLRAAASRGLVMIAAVGNDRTSEPRWPAASPHVIAVTAVDAAMRRYSQANTGGHIEFAAPGVDLLVAAGNGGSFRSGTSYAAPIVTALAARLGGNSLNSVRANLRASAVDLGNPGRDGQFGWGLVQTGGC